jgi:hypothetical protein
MRPPCRLLLPLVTPLVPSACCGRVRRWWMCRTRHPASNVTSKLL